MVLTAAYALLLFPCIFGQLKTVYISKFADLSRREFMCLIRF
jgi:NADH:ubiquinone oxidoreductase subunit 4 (subunit M)